MKRTWHGTIGFLLLFGVVSLHATGAMKMKGITNDTFPLDACETIEALTKEEVVYTDTFCKTKSGSAFIEWNDDITLYKMQFDTKAVDKMFNVEYVNSGRFIKNFKNGYAWANDIQCNEVLKGNDIHHWCEKTDIHNGWYLNYVWVDKNGKKSIEKKLLIEFFDKGTKRLAERKTEEMMKKKLASQRQKKSVQNLNYFFYALNGNNTTLQNKAIKAKIVDMKVKDSCTVQDIQEPDSTTSRVKIICKAPIGKQFNLYLEDRAFALSLNRGKTFDFIGDILSVENYRGITVVEANMEK